MEWSQCRTPSIDVSHQSPSLLLEQPQQRRPQPFEGVSKLGAVQRQPGLPHVVPEEVLHVHHHLCHQTQHGEIILHHSLHALESISTFVTAGGASTGIGP